jgi:hypothetical protein
MCCLLSLFVPVCDLSYVVCGSVAICHMYVCGSVLTERERGEETRHSGRTENGTAFVEQV